MGLIFKYKTLDFFLLLGEYCEFPLKQRRSNREEFLRMLEKWTFRPWETVTFHSLLLGTLSARKLRFTLELNEESGKTY